jgi:hypothetical protein
MKQRMRLEWIICLVVVTLAIGGAALYGASTRIPEWTVDQETLNDLVTRYPAEFHGQSYEQHNRQWHRDMDAVRSLKWPLYDAGTGMLALAATIALGVLVGGFANWQTFLR